MIGSWLLMAKVELAHLFTIIAIPSLFAAVAIYVLNMRQRPANEISGAADTIRTADI
jgi:hypothetical protein